MKPLGRRIPPGPMRPAEVGVSPVTYRLGVSAFVVDGPAGHDWNALAPLSVRHYELSALHGPADLQQAVAALRPASFGIHWPLHAADGLAYACLSSTADAFANFLERIRDRVTGTGASYVLVHLAQRGEVWPDDGVVAARLWALHVLAAELGVEVVLEPKESIAQGDGLSGYVERVRQLPPGLALCLDTNDWASARRHLARGPDCLAGRAAYFHLHAMHVRPDSGRLYLHAPPWVPPGGDPDWPELHHPDPADLDVFAARDRTVTVQIEVHPRYGAQMPNAVTAVRERLAGLGWREVGG